MYQNSMTIGQYTELQWFKRCYFCHIENNGKKRVSCIDKTLLFNGEKHRSSKAMA